MDVRPGDGVDAYCVVAIDHNAEGMGARKDENYDFWELGEAESR